MTGPTTTGSQRPPPPNTPRNDQPSLTETQRFSGRSSYILDSWLQVHDVEETTRDNYRWYVEHIIRPALGDAPVKNISPRVLEELYAQLRRCRDRCNGKPAVEHRTAVQHECRTVRHRWPSGRPSARARTTHDCGSAGCETIECKQHVCRPMAAATVRQVHFILSSALGLAVRWEWIPSNPATAAKKPRRPEPQPVPPSSEEAAKIVEAAWEQDEDWGTLVWLMMMTGARRGELAALRWHDLHLDTGILEIRRSYNQRAGKVIEKDTKTHQMRRIALDEATQELLAAQKDRYGTRVDALGLEPKPDAFVFSYAGDHGRPCNPDALSHRYRRMCAELGIDSHPHALRHYSATELLSAGVDLRTVAGRLGHGGGGTTTLRVYAAWVAESDKRAAEILAGRVPSRPNPRAETQGTVVPLRRGRAAK